MSEEKQNNNKWNKKRNKKSSKKAKEDVISSWIGFITTSLIFLLLGIFLLGFQWWVFFVPAMVFISAISTTIEYYTKYIQKCPVCKSNLEIDSEYCRICGTHIKNKCDYCGSPLIHIDSRFCEKCGKPIYNMDKIIESTNVATIVNEEVDNNKSNENSKIRYCVSCGNKVKIGTKYCPYCGVNLSE